MGRHHRYEGLTQPRGCLRPEIAHSPRSHRRYGSRTIAPRRYDVNDTETLPFRVFRVRTDRCASDESFIWLPRPGEQLRTMTGSTLTRAPIPNLGKRDPGILPSSPTRGAMYPNRVPFHQIPLGCHHPLPSRVVLHAEANTGVVPSRHQRLRQNIYRRSRATTTQAIVKFVCACGHPKISRPTAGVKIYN